MLPVLTDPQQLAALAGVQAALQRLAAAFVCFGQPEPFPQ
jgi:hypothetical protein